jgi:hypothetical protein
VIEDRLATIRLAPRFTTAIRLPDTVNSVVLGDPGLFQAEHSPDEPLFVFVKPVGLDPAETSLMIVTSSGRRFVLLLKSSGEIESDAATAVDLLVVCRPVGSFLIPETVPSELIAESLTLENGVGSVPPRVDAEPVIGEPLPELMDRQRTERLVELHGDGLQVAIGKVLSLGSDLAVTFSVLNATAEPVELMPPQVQLAGQARSGFLGRGTRWTTVEQLPVSIFQLTHRRLDPGGRSDGMVIFERPTIKQSDETLLLQIARSGAIDRPVLVPVDWR